MVSILASLIFLLQGIPVLQGGKVTGVLRDSQGIPLAGVRMAAVARGTSVEEAATGVAMAGLAETDAQGRFTLEDIPPGRYSIAAGRLDLQTYYPGTQSLADARVLTIAAGETIADINFALTASSIGRSPGSGSVSIAQQITATIPVKVNVENGGRLPISADDKFVNLRLEPPSRGSIIPIDGSAFIILGPITTTTDFRVVVDNLPDGYEVKSIQYGSRTIPHGIFQLTAANFVQRSPTQVIVGPATGPPPTPPTNQQDLQAYLQAVAAYDRARALVGAGLLAPSTIITVSTPAVVPAATPPSALSITIGESARTPTTGVRVSGHAGKDRRRVYISGRGGILFSDGSFEFRGVPPGRHVIAGLGAPDRSAAVVVVGDQDLSGIQLREVSMFPNGIREPKDPMPAGDASPGTIMRLARLAGTVVEETSRVPVSEGELELRSGDSVRIIPIDEKGRFETFPLLPGTYDIHLKIFGHSASARTIVVGDKDADLEITTRRLY